MPSPSLTGRDDEDRSLRELEVLTVAEIEAIVLATESEHEGVWTRRISKSLHAAITSGLARNHLIAAAPDMYAALKACPLPSEYTSARAFSNAFEKWLSTKSAALSKASGGER